MNRAFSRITLTLLVLAVLGFGANPQSSADQTPVADAGRGGPIAGAAFAAIPGGYHKVSPLDPEVVAAVDFAIKEQSKKGKTIKLKSISTASQQVVAGMNYCVELVVDEAGAERKAEVIVYRDLQQNHKLTSWTWK